MWLCRAISQRLPVTVLPRTLINQSETLIPERLKCTPGGCPPKPVITQAGLFSITQPFVSAQKLAARLRFEPPGPLVLLSLESKQGRPSRSNEPPGSSEPKGWSQSALDFLSRGTAMLLVCWDIGTWHCTALPWENCYHACSSMQAVQCSLHLRARESFD